MQKRVTNISLVPLKVVVQQPDGLRVELTMEGGEVATFYKDISIMADAERLKDIRIDTYR